MQKRLLFDPKRVAADGGKAQPARRESKGSGSVTAAGELTVSQLADLIKATLEQRLTSPIRVTGELSNLSKRGHWYFSLKDDSAVVQCVAWASSAKRFGFEPTDGMEVLASGSVSHFPPQGRTQLYVTGLKPVGEGALDAKYRQLCDDLRREGYFDASRKKLLPAMPRRIAVLTSAGGAAVQDVIATARARLPAVGLVVVDVRVQGDGAAKQIAHGLSWIDRRADQLGIDAILVTRGGGSLEDLWAFNERIVADAALRCSLPVVAAIGHESDTTIIELVADARGATPTQAAMLLVPDRSDLTRQVRHLQDRLIVTTQRRLTLGDRQQAELAREIHHAIRHRLARAHKQVDRLAHMMIRSHPHAVLSRRRERIGVLADRLARAVRRSVDRHETVSRLAVSLRCSVKNLVQRRRQGLDAVERELRAIDPRLVLKRGYSMTTNPSGELIRSAAEVKAGASIDTHFADGTIRSVVGGRRARRRRLQTDDDEQLDLFDSAE